MHEYGLTSVLIENIINEVESRLAKRVLDVEVEIGEFTFLNSDQIEFCYEALIPNSILEGSKIRFIKKEGKVKCDSCLYEGKASKTDFMEEIYFAPITFKCPNCDGYTKIVEGQDFIIRKIKIVA